jgi:hypothetical protein
MLFLSNFRAFVARRFRSARGDDVMASLEAPTAGRLARRPAA